MTWSYLNPDVHRVTPLEFPEDYARRSVRSGGDMQCVWIGLAAVAVVYVLMGQQRQLEIHERARQLCHNAKGVASMITRRVTEPVANVVAGMLTDVQEDASPPAAGTVVKDVEMPPQVKLLDGEEADKPASAERKTANHRMLVKYVNSDANSRACIIIFANWCPHCKTLLKELSDRANKASMDGVKFLLVNGEAVDPAAFTGDSAIVELRHFPTILCKVGQTGTEVSSLDEAEKVLAEQPTTTDEPVSAKVATVDAAEDAAADPFESLF